MVPRPRSIEYGRLLPALLLSWLGAMCVPAASSEPPAAGPQGGGPVNYTFRIVNTYPHDPRAYTQGLIYKDGFLYESTGRNGESSLRKVKLDTGEVLQIQPVDAKHFAEGLTEWRNQLLQLTWKDGLGFVYELPTFKRLRTFTYSGEGWGLTHDGTRLLLSDGSSTLRWLNPETFQESGRITVRDRGQPVLQLNELECI